MYILFSRTDSAIPKVYTVYEFYCIVLTFDIKRNFWLYVFFLFLVGFFFIKEIKVIIHKLMKLNVKNIIRVDKKWSCGRFVI